jgi:hypothetical protein
MMMQNFCVCMLSLLSATAFTRKHVVYYHHQAKTPAPPMKMTKAAPTATVHDDKVVWWMLGDADGDGVGVGALTTFTSRHW